MGFTLSGVMGGQMEDGTRFEVRTGDVFDVPPGHDNWVVGDATGGGHLGRLARMGQAACR
jgi:quercetin dioxygenase-like cupin family protein